MGARRTTIGCSALALTVALHDLVSAQSAQLGLFPTRTLWTLPLNSMLTAPPGFDGTHGYFPIEGDRLVAYNVAQGEQIWLIQARSLWQPASGEGLVFIVQPDAIVALDERNGSAAWRLPFTEPLAARPVWDNGWLVASTVSGTILAFRALDGHLIWRRDAGARLSAPPALAADRVYVPLEDRRLLALRVETGGIVWERRLGGPATDLLALEDRLYAGATDNFLYCIETDDGQIDWRVRTGADVIGVPVVDGDRVYFVSLDNVLRGLNRKGGSQQWKRALPMRPRSGPLLAGDRLIVGGIATTLRAYTTRTGALAGEISLEAELSAPVHLVPTSGLPLLVAVINDLVNGATVTAITRAIEPPTVTLAPLPNPTLPPPPLIP